MAQGFNTTIFHGLKFPLAVDRQTGRLSRETDYDSYIRELIRQVLLTAQGERINRPDFGAGLRHHVFAPNSPATASLLQTIIYQALTTWLGTLITVDQVVATPDEGRLDIVVVYTVRARGEKRELGLEVTL
jgi:phage baseplate assembly protein W